MIKVYHGCGLVNVDRARKLIELERGERCIHTSDHPFWKCLQYCERTGIKTRSEKKAKLAIVIYIFANWIRKT